MRIRRIQVGTEIDKINALCDFLHGQGYDRIEIEKRYEEDGYWIETELAVVIPTGKTGWDSRLHYLHLGFSLGYNAGVVASLNKMAERTMKLAR